MKRKLRYRTVVKGTTLKKHFTLAGARKFVKSLSSKRGVSIKKIGSYRKRYRSRY